MALFGLFGPPNIERLKQDIENLKKTHDIDGLIGALRHRDEYMRREAA